MYSIANKKKARSINNVNVKFRCCLFERAKITLKSIESLCVTPTLVILLLDGFGDSCIQYAVWKFPLGCRLARVTLLRQTQRPLSRVCSR